MASVKNRKFDLWKLLIETDITLSSKGVWDSYELGKLLYDASSRIAQTDSFYVGLYNEGEQKISFPFSWDLIDGEGSPDSAGLRPLGQGPSSWVIVHRKTLVLDENTVGIQRAGTTFGDRKRLSESAIHAPMQAIGLDGELHLVGVTSMQSYQANAYDDLTQICFEWLASRAARTYRRIHDIEEHRELSKLQIIWRGMLEEQVHDFGEILFNVTKHAKKIEAMCRDRVHPSKIQAEVHELWVASASAHSSLVEQVQRKKVFPKYSTEQNRVSTLSPREQNVLIHLASGIADSEIGRELHISEETVKTHIKNIRSKLALVGCSRERLIDIAQNFSSRRENQPSELH